MHAHTSRLGEAPLGVRRRTFGEGKLFRLSTQKQGYTRRQSSNRILAHASIILVDYIGIQTRKGTLFYRLAQW